MRLPQEVIAIIVAHLIYSLPSLRSCSLTCYSWYIVTVPHLHTTLTVVINSWFSEDRWPNPIHRMHTSSLLPFVKTFRIRGLFCHFYPNRFNYRILRQFSALSNVEKLEIDNLDIPSFIPRLRQYFSYSLQTLRSLNLVHPKGTNRQIIFFIGSFQHLKNLTLGYSSLGREEPENDPTLTPPFSPPLQGQLVVFKWTKADFFQDMVHLFGEIRFRAVSLAYVSETRFLLRACAETLQLLHLSSTHLLGEQS
jgi:hypothetical protein